MTQEEIKLLAKQLIEELRNSKETDNRIVNSFITGSLIGVFMTIFILILFYKC